MAVITEWEHHPTVPRQPTGAGTRQHFAACTMAAEARSVPTLRAFARDLATQWGAPAETVYALRLIVTELITNVLLHSGSPEVSLLLVVDGSTAAVEVRDTGTWRTRRPVAELPEQAVDGRGLWLVHAYSESCRLERTSKGTTVRAEFQMPPPARDGTPATYVTAAQPALV